MLNLKLLAAVALAATIVASLTTFQVQQWRYTAEIKTMQAAHDKASRDAEALARRRENTLQTAIDNIQAQSNEREKQYEADIAAANARADSMRDARAKRTERAIADTRTAGGGEAARQTLRVYSELLDRADARDRAVSEFADRAYDAGIDCMRAYNEIRGTK